MTFTLSDPAGTVYTLLSTHWTAANINGTITPTFGRMEQLGAKRFAIGHILVYPRVRNLDDVGRGSHFDITDTATIEVRVKDVSSDTIPMQMLQEVYRIIGSYRLTAGGSYDYIKIKNVRDESYQANNFYRYLVEIELYQYGVSKT